MQPKALLQACVWPLTLLANMAAVVAAATLMPDRLSQVAAATTGVLLLVLLAVERFWPYREDWGVRGDSEVWRDIGHIVAYAAIAANAARLLFLVVLAGAISASGLPERIGIWPATSPVLLQIAIVIVVGDALEYGYHRLAHHSPWLWRLHAIHHTPVRLHVLKGGRHHVLYAFGRGVAVWLPLMLLGAPGEPIYWQYIAVTITGLVSHANIRFRIPGFMHRVLVTPEFHRIHHAADPGVGNTNFGVVFPVWDMAFGTQSDPLRTVVADAGIRHDPIPRRFIEELKSPFTYRRLEQGLGEH
jgi:sterol desaturase/sphingolipid hydroxylase (fatty acid hydroxylase superfamily)